MQFTVGQAIALGIGLGLVCGGALMALWAARRIQEEAARQFDRGFERGRWLTDVRAATDDGGAVKRMALLLGAAPSSAQLAAADPELEPHLIIAQR